MSFVTTPTSLINVVAQIGIGQWLVLLGIFLVSYNYVAKEFWRNLPPGPPCLPIVGSLPFLAADIRKPLMKMADKYGEVVTIYLASRRVVVLNGYEAVRDAFAKSSHAFSGRPTLFVTDHIAQGYGIIFTQGDFWKEQRRHSLHILKDFGMGRSIFEENILDEIGFFLKEIDNNKGPFSPQPLIQKSVCNVICYVTCGKRMDYDDPTFIFYMKVLNDSFSILGNTSALTLFPSVRHLPGDFFQFKKLMGYKKFMDKEYQGWIDEHLQAADDGKEPTDFIGAYIKIMQTEKAPDKQDTSFSVPQLLRIVADLFGAGTETTSTTLTWAVMYMSLHPEIQTKLQAEIDDVIGVEELPRMHHRNQLPYTEACILEIQRISDIVPLGVPHATIEDVHFKGYLIPKGTMVMANMYSVHHDPKLWPKPEKFDPRRFLDNEGNVVRREELIPFSTGKRICLGEGLARMELFLYFTAMLHRFRFRPAEGYPLPDTDGVLAVTNMPKPFMVTADVRTFS